MNYLKLRLPTHNTGSIPIEPTGEPTPWHGGIFGQPANPTGRTGNFVDHWAIPPEYADGDTGVFAPKTFLRIPGTSMSEQVPPLTEGINATQELETLRRLETTTLKAAVAAQAAANGVPPAEAAAAAAQVVGQQLTVQPSILDPIKRNWKWIALGVAVYALLR